MLSRRQFSPSDFRMTAVAAASAGRAWPAILSPSIECRGRDLGAVMGDWQGHHSLPAPA